MDVLFAIFLLVESFNTTFLLLGDDSLFIRLLLVCYLTESLFDIFFITYTLYNFSIILKKKN